MDEDRFAPRLRGPLSAPRERPVPADASDTERAVAAIIPLQPLSGKPIRDGSEALAALRDRALDAERGFATLSELAEPDFRPVAEAFYTLHLRHAAAIGRILSDRGLPLDREGSFIGNVNAAVVTVRAFFGKIDGDVMVHVRDGEQTVLKAFDIALAAPLRSTEAAALRHLRNELSTLLSQTRAWA